MANAAGATQQPQGQQQQQQQQRQQRSGRRAVVWFRNDLRLRDNAALAAVAERVRAGDVADVVPLYVFDPRTFGPSEFGTPKTGPHRWVCCLLRIACA
jgi:deoxyribodipyrimidine photolyase